MEGKRTDDPLYPMVIEVSFSGFQQRLLLNDQLFRAHIYTGSREPPEAFNVALITLEAHVESNLNWTAAIEKAKSLTEKGIWILWELDFDLYADSLTDEVRFSTLKLSVEHFTKTIWPLFRDHTLGVVVYRGGLDFSRDFPWDFDEKEGQDLFCRDVVVEYLKLLSASFPESLSCFVFLDCSAISEPLAFFQLTNREKWSPFQLALKGGYSQTFPLSVPALGWDHGCSSLGVCSEVAYELLPEKKVDLALLLPSKGEREEINGVVSELSKPFHVIPEQLLTSQWEGIEKLIVFSDSVTEKVRRKLLGFCAAEGTVITVGKPLSLPEEVDYYRELLNWH